MSATAENDRGPMYAQQALAAIHRGNPRRISFTLGYGTVDKSVSPYCRFPNQLKTLIANQLATAYGPACRFTRHADDLFKPPTGYRRWTTDICLCPQLDAFATPDDYQDTLQRNLADPVAQILAAIGGGSHDRCVAQLEITLHPASERRCRQAQHTNRVLASSFFDVHPILKNIYAHTATHPAMVFRPAAWAIAMLARLSQDKSNPRQSHVNRHLFETRIRITVFAPKGQRWKARQKLRQVIGSLGVFTIPRKTRWYAPRGFLLSTEQVATLWHPPTQTVRAPKMQINTSRDLEAPVVLPSEKEEGTATLGRVKFRSRNEVFGIRSDDRRRHVAIVGKTGVGKSTLIGNMIRADIAAGRGVGLIDPHGDQAEATLEAVPKHRTNDVIYFDAGDRTNPISFNPLDCSDPAQRPLVASGVLAAFKKIYGDSWGPRMEHIFRNALLALVEHRETSLLSLQRMLSDAGYRKQIVGQVQDPAVRLFWQTEFAGWKPHFQAEAVAPIQNKIGQFISNPLLRSIIGQPQTSLQLRQAMDQQQILIVNLSKGRIGEDASALLGSLLVSGIQLAAMSRADVTEGHRPDLFLYVDEFQNFATDAFATILSEARKYRLNLTIANQYLQQMKQDDNKTYHAVFGNVGSLLSFQVGSDDAELLAEQFAGDVQPTDLIRLPKYTAYVRLSIDGMPSRPFSMTTLPPAASKDGKQAEIIRRTSQQRYGTPAAQVAKQLNTALAA